MVEVEVPLWLRGLPLAPEYHPSETEFLDPIAYILTIEQEASKFGICKIVPPFVKASKRAVVNNLNMSLSRSHEAVTKTAEEGLSPPMARSISSARTITATVAKSGGLDMEDGWKPKFTTRWQQLGCNSRKSRAFPQFVSQKSVWQSGESYTLDQFEAKAKIFSRNRLGTSKEVAPLSVEALFWKAESEKAISIEYANDIPGSAFGRGTSECTVMTSCKKRKRKRCVDSEEASEEGLGQVEEDKVNMSEEKDETGKEGEYPRGLGLEPNSQTRHSDGCKLTNSAWNMRNVARSPGSLLQFMPNEVPGVTSPMVYIGMLFSWFAWHVEDHELHSLNYLHMGASKTWYAVPGEAATALEEVVQVYGYGGELNSRDAFARLGEKTTLMSPEILVAVGVPCCRLVQNAGEYVVTFPRAYHLGFSHGFNCGEAANFATPVWLDLAREAAARRAAMNYLPMLSHQQLLYLLAMSIASRPPLSSPTEVRTSCLKEKKRIGEEIVKTVFVNDVISHNSLLGKLINHGVTSCILLSDVCNVTLPAPSLMHSNVIVGCTSMHDFSSKLDLEDHFRTMCPEKKVDPLVEGDRGAIQGAPSCLHDAIVTTPYLDSAASSSGECLDCQDWDGGCSTFQDEVHSPRKDIAESNPVATTSLFDWGTLPCAVCGILCYAGLAVVQPSQAAASVFKSWQASKAALELQSISRQYRGASTPQVLCLEHAVDAQRQLEPLGGSHVLVIFHSSYAETEQLAKQLAAEMGIEHEWRSTAFEKASHNDLSTICAALRAEEDKGYQDWVTQLGLVDHNTTNATSSNVDDLDINLGHERIGAPGIKSRVKGKHSKVKKCTVVGQWCGQGLQMDQLPPLLGGCQMLTSQTEVTILPSVSLCGENISTALEVGRSRKVSQSLELTHHNPEQLDVDFDITKLGRRMETLLGEHSNEESIQWCRGVTHPLGYNSNSGACVNGKDDSGTIPVSGQRTTLRKTKLDRGESIKYKAQQALAVWERLGKRKKKDQIATRNLAESSSNYFLETGENKELEWGTLAPGGVQWHHDSSQSTVADKQEIFHPNDLDEGNKTNNLQPCPNDQLCEVGNCCSVVGDYLQRGAKIQALQRLCRQQSTPVSHSLSMADKFSSLDTFSCNKVSTQKVVLCLKRKSFMGGHQDSGKLKLTGASNGEEHMLSCMHCASMRLQRQRPSMTDMECEGSDAHGSPDPGPYKKDGKSEKRRKARKPKAIKQCEEQEGEFQCSFDGCCMGFDTEKDLELHMLNRCTWKGCGKHFHLHKYLLQHRRVHLDDRPLKCPWKGCTQSFKWAWARTEHMRVHTGERPYKCTLAGCGLTFRFVSDFSRHKRNTGHKPAS
ncbi:unnamed protein product [Sphagnum compactum]